MITEGVGVDALAAVENMPTPAPSAGELSHIEARVLEWLVVELGSSEAYRKAFRKRIHAWAMQLYPERDERTRERIARRYVAAFNRLTAPETALSVASPRAPRPERRGSGPTRDARRG